MATQEDTEIKTDDAEDGMTTETNDELFESMLAEESEEPDDDGTDPDGTDPDSNDGSADDDGTDSDDEEDEEEDGRKDPKDRRRQSVVRRLQASESRVLELERELKSVRAELPSQRRSSGDVVDDLIESVSSRFKDVRDPLRDDRVRSILFEIGGDILAELHSDIDDDAVKARLASRRQRKRDAEVQRQIDELKSNNAAKDREVARAHGVSQMTRHLESSKAQKNYPYLYAGEDDVPSVILDGIATLVESGHKIDDSNVADTIEYVCKTIDDDHRGKFSRLEKLRNKEVSSDRHIKKVTRETTRGVQESGRKDRMKNGGRTVTASVAGPRKVPEKKAEVSQDELFEQMLREEQAERRRNASRRRR